MALLVLTILTFSILDQTNCLQIHFNQTANAANELYPKEFNKTQDDRFWPYLSWKSLPRALRSQDSFTSDNKKNLLLTNSRSQFLTSLSRSINYSNTLSDQSANEEIRKKNNERELRKNKPRIVRFNETNPFLVRIVGIFVADSELPYTLELAKPAIDIAIEKVCYIYYSKKY